MTPSSSTLETSPLKIYCKEDYGNQNEHNSGSIEQQWLGMMTVLGNCFFSLAFFTTSYFVDSIEMGFLAFRLLVIAAHITTSYVALNKDCDTRVILWSTIFILVNVYKLLHLAYNLKPTR